MSVRPKVTVAIPLFKSARFFDNIVTNIEGMKDPDTEILISDRHCLDDSIDRLEKYFRDDHRIRFIKRKDRINWVEHINALLQVSKGRYWRFLPHDDSFPPNSLEALVEELELNHDAILAYGPTRALSIDDVSLPHYDCLFPHPQAAKDGWTLGLVLRMFWEDFFTGAFKGLVRREMIIRHQVFIKQTKDNILPERCWLFALCLVGQFRFVPEATYIKRFYEGSLHSGWIIKGSNILGAADVMCKYLWELLDSGEIRQYGSSDLLKNASNIANWIDSGEGEKPVYQPVISPGWNQFRSLKLPVL